MAKLPDDLQPDPMIEAYKKDIDRTLLRENLKLTVDERVRNLMALQRAAEEFRRARRARRLEACGTIPRSPMTDLQYLTDQDGEPRAVVVPIELWRRLLPREDASAEELVEAIEDYCLNKAMNEGAQTPLVTRDEALRSLED